MRTKSTLGLLKFEEMADKAKDNSTKIGEIFALGEWACSNRFQDLFDDCCNLLIEDNLKVETESTFGQRMFFYSLEKCLMEKDNYEDLSNEDFQTVLREFLGAFHEFVRTLQCFFIPLT